MTEKKPSPALWYWGPPIAWVVVMQVLTFGPQTTPRTVWFPGMDKVVHLLYFGAFALLLLRALHAHRRMAIWPAAVAACLATVAYGTADELAQFLQAHRVVELADWLANLAGAGVALIVPCFSNKPRP